MSDGVEDVPVRWESGDGTQGVTPMQKVTIDGKEYFSLPGPFGAITVCMWEEDGKQWIETTAPTQDGGSNVTLHELVEEGEG